MYLFLDTAAGPGYDNSRLCCYAYMTLTSQMMFYYRWSCYPIGKGIIFIKIMLHTSFIKKVFDIGLVICVESLQRTYLNTLHVSLK